MRKRVAEKVITRLVLNLAVYPGRTIRRAMHRRPSFWTSARPGKGGGTKLKVTFSGATDDAKLTFPESE
jgi:hypothetical protein